MLSPRAESILMSIINRYIERGIPVSSQSLVEDGSLRVSSATVRNEMALLEQEGYIIRPHTSAGSVPSDKGYRHYVGAISEAPLPLSEQHLIDHLFHQVEGKLDEWLSLTAAIMAQLSRNMAVVTIPRPADCVYRHLEAVVLQDVKVLVILVMRGAVVRQQLITLTGAIAQHELTALTDKLNAVFLGLTRSQIKAKDINPTPMEQQLTDCVTKIMQTQDELGYNQCYLEGLHFILGQPEFSQNQLKTHILELLRNRSLLLTILSREQDTREVQVVIGSENEVAETRECGLVISRYGLPAEALGTIGVIGPTRMPYPHIISTVSYLSSVLSKLVGELYGIRTYSRFDSASTN